MKLSGVIKLDKVKDLDIKAIDSIVNEYDASDDEGKSKLKTDFIKSYSNSVAKSKDVSEEDAKVLLSRNLIIFSNQKLK